MPEVTIPNRFVPRPYQKKFMRYFDRGGKRAVWVVHRRGGKDLTALHQTAKQMFRRVGVYWHVFPTAEQARKAIWEGFTSAGERVMEQVFPEVIRKSPRAFLPASEMIVELTNGSIWRLLGSDHIEVVGAGPIGVVFSEFALAKPNTWDLIRPMLRENGGWAAFITTPRGNNHAKRLYDVAGREPGWFRDLQTLYDTRAYDPDETISGERAEGMPEALIRQEYLCDWTAALVGSVWGDLLEGVEKAGGLSDFGHDRDGIFTAWDLGIGDATAIWWFRLEDGRVDLLDYYEAQGKPLSHYVDELARRETELGWQHLKHWLPHDAAARTLATGVSILNQLQDDPRIGTKVDIGPRLSLADGIQAGRWLLQRSVRFHPRCAQGVEALKQYHYAFDAERKTFKTTPNHDWSSHGADAFRYVAQVVKVSELAKPQPEEAPTPAFRSAQTLTLDEVWESQPRRRRA